MPLVLMSSCSGPDEVMKGIELGAVDFLETPVSQLKLRNIWQHVVRKVSSFAIANTPQLSDLCNTHSLHAFRLYCPLHCHEIGLLLCSTRKVEAQAY